MSQPPKGFGKFQRKDKQPKSQPEVESPKNEEEPPTKKESDSKTEGQKQPEMPDFSEWAKEFKFGGGGGPGNNNIQQVGGALAALVVLYYLYQTVSVAYMTCLENLKCDILNIFDNIYLTFFRQLTKKFLGNNFLLNIYWEAKWTTWKLSTINGCESL